MFWRLTLPIDQPRCSITESTSYLHRPRPNSVTSRLCRLYDRIQAFHNTVFIYYEC